MVATKKVNPPVRSVQREDSSAPINENIKAPRVQLITHEGQNVGVVTREQALHFADTVGLDLVLLNDTGPVPICKIMNHGKVLYERKKKLADSKKHQKVIQVKEIKIRPKIGEHDYETKIAQAVQFLKEGKRVKVTLCFRGRENVSKDERGVELFDKIDASFADHGIKGLMTEADSRMGQFWSRVYYVK
ncbi:MAG TPA: translation initiation factor IF-3 [Candidatus Babeliales bacterium]|jgi:translation initiation factor IF-3|nr:translation initiation factor IF-3 [Candidatus Babeliales bacterium]